MKSLGRYIWIISSVLGGLMIATACEKSARVETTRWHGDGPMPAVPFGAQETSQEVSTGGNKIKFQQQQVDGVPVEGTYLKSLERQGKPQFVAYRWISSPATSLRKKILKYKDEQPRILEKLYAHYADMKSKKLLMGPDLFLYEKGSLRLGWKAVFEEKDGTLILFKVDSALKLLDISQLGSQFVDATAALFPKGPLKSDLSDVVLKNLFENQNLESMPVLMRTEADQVATSEKNQFRFSSEDLRFSQVQSFFYVTESLRWFAKSFGFELPFRLEVETQKGYPQKTNTAFYYLRKIRLGEGDDVAYSRIPLDPSIVTHESVHAVVEAVAHLPYEGEGGSLNEAFADFFTALQLDNPRMGEAAYKKEPFKRNIQNDLLASQKNGGLYHDSLLVSGLLWAVRGEVGKEIASRLAWNTLLRLTPDSDFATFADELMRSLSQESNEVQNKIRDVYKNRGWSEVKNET